MLYSFAQAALLLAQDSHLGARFFLPRFFLPSLGLTDAETWDYHPLLAPSDVEGGQLPEDCPICLEPIVLGDKEDRELGMAGRARWAYMCPPCHHVAHTECLESWLAIKVSWDDRGGEREEADTLICRACARCVGGDFRRCRRDVLAAFIPWKP